ncbi:protein cornichon homolog 4-like [Panonychus citri]|uniref:protein cornichon homolog 4-like n=1 Tax=Panonychus citri TaxID=50023 RepID=UPI002306F1EE|nr:protein cornichon homolog 4-like [Panonychus citri]
MNLESLLFAFAIADTGCLLFLSIYFIITLSDLECDYINARDCCNKLNPLVKLEIFGHGIITIALLLTGHWILFIFNAPLTLWMIYRYCSVPQGNMGLFDPTEIYHRGNLKQYTTHSIVHLCFQLVHFFIYLYCLIISLLTSS